MTSVFSQARGRIKSGIYGCPVTQRYICETCVDQRASNAVDSLRVRLTPIQYGQSQRMRFVGSTGRHQGDQKYCAEEPECL